MVGFKSKTQESQKGKQLVVVILIWGEKKKTHKKSKPKPQTSQSRKPEESLVDALCFFQPTPSPPNFMLQIFSYIVQLNNLQTLNTFLCLYRKDKEQISQETERIIMSRTATTKFQVTRFLVASY